MLVDPTEKEAPKYFTPVDLRTYNFTGWDWRRIPKDAVKAARNGAVQGFKVIGKLECVNCKRWMWTCDLAREDTCEECDYFLRDRNWELKRERAKRNNLKPVNPFAEPGDGDHSINPFKGLL